ncbi:hypothetical protein CDD82_6979 [Ophiocordyceps australis]|uniref:Peptide N-acetyl-beta-D-glucosaminyl asparaginase amidase A N-terminal domain-containing protein n=1 Tax=Ophiocordyceps australis TaxID=1399860 RepID=A0A2C5XFL5_9HYPO|nr:hypothetical protein CDD82_6979 [Ophiocordyceps australis]
MRFVSSLCLSLLLPLALLVACIEELGEEVREDIWVPEFYLDPDPNPINALKGGDGAPPLSFYTDEVSWQDTPSPQANDSVEPLRCFQVSPPVLDSHGLVVGHEYVDEYEEELAGCQVHLLDNVPFANSYGHPHVVEYTPPNCRFNRVVINMTVTSSGRQFDRLGSLWLGDVEAWRFSTAEPKPGPGIVWTQWKDVTHLKKLWTMNQTIILDLGNLVNEKYTAPYYVTLTARFFRRKRGKFDPVLRPADQIEAITAKRSKAGLGSALVYEGEPVQSWLQLPRNIVRAVISIAATGQGDEEFWWANVPDDAVDVFRPNVTLPGRGGYRELRVLIDGHLVGLVFPFPIVFTGGISPPMHRPLVGPQAFDLREHQIDVTPWLGLLCNGQRLNVTIQVVAHDGHPVPSSWVISGKMFLWLGIEGTISQGNKPRVKMVNQDDPPRILTDPPHSLSYRHIIDRLFTVESEISRHNHTDTVFWNQTFAGKNRGFVARYGDMQQVHSTFHGEDTWQERGLPVYYHSYTYPIVSSYDTQPGKDPYVTITNASLTHGEEFVMSGRGVFPTGLEAFDFPETFPYVKGGISLSNLRSARGLFFQRRNGSSFGFGTASEGFRLGARAFYHELTNPQRIADPALYNRKVTVVNESIMEDTWDLYRPRGIMQLQEPRARKIGLLGNQFVASGRLPAVQRKGN